MFQSARLLDCLRSHHSDNNYYSIACVGGFTGDQKREALEGIIRKLVRLGYLPLFTPSFEILCNTADSNLLASILNNSCNVLNKQAYCYQRFGSLAIPCDPVSSVMFDDLSKKYFLTGCYPNNHDFNTSDHSNFTFSSILTVTHPRPFLPRFSITVSNS